jgi:hypothetical protein
MFALMYCLDRRNLKYLQPAFLLLWAVSVQIVVMLCLDYSVCFYIYMIAVLLLINFPKCRKEYIYFFLLIGMLTSYNDLLTYPLITLAIPLIVFLCMSPGDSFASQIKKCLWSSGSWAIGYLGQWMAKWLIASLVLSDNVILDAAKQFMIRSSSSVETNSSVEQATFYHTLSRNLAVMEKKGFVFLFTVVVISFIFYIYRSKAKITVKTMPPFVLIACFPFLWYLVTRNHAYEHYWMTWRNLTISVFAISCGVLYAVHHGRAEKQII